LDIAETHTINNYKDKWYSKKRRKWFCKFSFACISSIWI